MCNWTEGYERWKEDKNQVREIEQESMGKSLIKGEAAEEKESERDFV